MVLTKAQAELWAQRAIDNWNLMLAEKEALMASGAWEDPRIRTAFYLHLTLGASACSSAITDFLRLPPGAPSPL